MAEKEININRESAEILMTKLLEIKKGHIKIIENIKTDKKTRTLLIARVRKIESYEQYINSQLRRNRFHE